MKTVYLNLTTIPQEPTKGLLDLYEKKYKSIKDFQIRKDVEVSFKHDGGLNPLFGKIYSIQIGFVSEKTLRVQVIRGKEGDILRELFNLLNGDFFSSFDVAVWSAKYTLPYITTRMISNKIPISSLPRVLQHLGMKPWEIKTIGVSDYIEGVGYYKGSLEEHYYNAFGEALILIPYGGVVDMVEDGLSDLIDNDGILHIIAISKLHLSYIGEEIFSDVQKNDAKIVGEVKVKELTGKELLIKKGLLSDKLAEEIIKEGIPKGKKKKQLKDLILANVLPEKATKQAVEDKTKEVEIFFEKLNKQNG